MDKQAAFLTSETNEAPSALGARLRAGRGDLGEGVDFDSRQAERDRVQRWLAAGTALAALAVLVVVSISVLHAG